MSEREGLLTTAEAAKLTGRATNTVMRWIRRGELEVARMDGRQQMVRQSDVQVIARRLQEAELLRVGQSRAAEQYAALTEALTEQDPACLGNEWFTFDPDDLDTDFRGELAKICDRCPLFDLCRAFAVAEHPAGGMWAGHYYTPKTWTRPDLRGRRPGQKREETTP